MEKARTTPIPSLHSDISSQVLLEAIPLLSLLSYLGHRLILFLKDG
jgi:hypothetical protein